ncbi:MAG TPA: glycosyltransferase family 2 protein, partial [Candidatus Sumerlaeia bacterium]|nr:glycosyltransferase family 2 protein [Candidatus Sumerlaeia bacterium]
MSGAWQTIVALPAYNEEQSLPALLDSFETLIQNNAALKIRIVVVNDGSKDNTLGILEAYRGRLPLEIVNHPQNLGLGQAIRTCLREGVTRAQSDDDIIICMDSDNTHLPEYIPALIEKIQKGSDIVIASRYQTGSREVGVPALRRLYSRGARFLFWVFLRLPNVRDYTCGYRAYRAGLIKRALEIYGDGIITRNGFACTDDLLVRLATLTKKISEIPFVLRYDKKIGESKLPLLVTIKETFKLLIQNQERFPKDSPDNPAAPFFEGIRLYDAGRFEEAIQAF